MRSWSPNDWQQAVNALPIPYGNRDALQRCTARVAAYPPLVTSGEIERLRQELARAEAGDRFVLMGGDCAERLADCRPQSISARLKVLFQMALVLGDGAGKRVVRIGRLAGQYSKPRSEPVETRLVNGVLVSYPSYFGDLINDGAFDAKARAPDPERLVLGHQHAALTLNFVRGLADGGFADVHRADAWEDPGGAVPESLRLSWQACVARARSVGGAPDDTLWVSHEGLNLDYESALTRRVPRRDGWWCLSTHLPWIGDRTRHVDGAHVAFFRGVRNPIGLKWGPSMRPDEVSALLGTLNPENESGKIVIITRFGAGGVRTFLPPLVEAVNRSGQRALWLCDPMHGNTRVVRSGRKSRDVDDVLVEALTTLQVHNELGSRLGGLHVEISGEDVTECTGAGLTEKDLDTRYESLCDPRLNRAQALAVAMTFADALRW